MPWSAWRLATAYSKQDQRASGRAMSPDTRGAPRQASTCATVWACSGGDRDVICTHLPKSRRRQRKSSQTVKPGSCTNCLASKCVPNPDTLVHGGWRAHGLGCLSTDFKTTMWSLSPANRGNSGGSWATRLEQQISLETWAEMLAVGGTTASLRRQRKNRQIWWNLMKMRKNKDNDQSSRDCKMSSQM